MHMTLKSSSLAWDKLILFLALVLGTVARFIPELMVDFPLNDGGMFLSMIRDLRANGYILPSVTSYNLTGIPYAYPPFGFYVAGWLTALGFNEIFLLRFLPALFISVAIYGMYLLASSLYSREVGAWAALLFALTPRSYAWQIMGGGLTRSLGFALILFTGWAVYHLFREGSRKWLITSVVFSALMVLSHPEAAIHGAAFCLYLWLFYGRTRRSTLQAVSVILGTVLLSAPWWGMVLAYHGLDPFLSVMLTGRGSGHGFTLMQRFIGGILPMDNLLPILLFLFVLGMVYGLLKREVFLLLWILLPYVVEPRSAAYMVLFPLSILAALFIGDVSKYMVSGTPVASSRKWDVRNVWLILVVYLFLECYLFDLRSIGNRLSSVEQASMAWVREHTMTGKRFVILTGQIGIEADAFQEWFPALAERTSLTTFQGTEWTLGSQFFPWFRELVDLQACQSSACLESWMETNKVIFDYVLVRKRTISAELLHSLESDGQFMIVHEDAAVVMLAHR